MGRPQWKRYAKLAVKMGLAAVVLWAVGRHVGRTWSELRRHGETLHLDPVWIFAAGLVYLAGLTACGVVYGKVMASSPSPIAMAPAIRAYIISHLGKYVPGKAMVVVMRVGLSVPFGARPATAAFATFYETLTMMAAGALLAAVAFALGSSPVQLVPLGLACGLAVALLVVVGPEVFPRLSSLAAMPFPNVGAVAQPNYSRRLLGVGLLWSALGWLLLGLSQVAVVRAMTPGGVPPGVWLLIAGSVALATVAGFVIAVLPGGLGVREWTLMTTLAPALGDETAVVSALALRLTWVAVEAIAAAVLAVVRPPLPDSESSLAVSSPSPPRLIPSPDPREP